VYLNYLLGLTKTGSTLNWQNLQLCGMQCACSVLYCQLRPVWPYHIFTH